MEIRRGDENKIKQEQTGMNRCETKGFAILLLVFYDTTGRKEFDQVKRMKIFRYKGKKELEEFRSWDSF